jgi:hypothetical protein
MKKLIFVLVLLIILVSSYAYINNSLDIEWSSDFSAPMASKKDINLQITKINPSVNIISWETTNGGSISPSTDLLSATYTSIQDFVGVDTIKVNYQNGSTPGILKGVVRSINTGIKCSTVYLEDASTPSNPNLLRIPVHGKVWIDVENKDEPWETRWILYWNNDEEIFDNGAWGNFRGDVGYNKDKYARGAVVKGPANIYLKHEIDGALKGGSKIFSGNYSKFAIFNTKGNHSVNLHIFKVDEDFHVGKVPPRPCN